MHGIIGRPELSEGDNCFFSESGASMLGPSIGKVERSRTDGQRKEASIEVNSWSTPSLFFCKEKKKTGKLHKRFQFSK